MKPNPSIIPLAERQRPRSLEKFFGQKHLLGPGKIINAIIEKKSLFSLILWGGPGCGKTTLARLIAESTGIDAHFVSAVSAGVGDVRAVIQTGVENKKSGQQTLLFLDEIHRFNKAQQDSVLGAVESGDIVLIGATTENPSFNVIAPLLSRCHVLKLEPLATGDLLAILDGAIASDEQLSPVAITDETKNRLVELASGDARRMLNILETAISLSADSTIDDALLLRAFGNLSLYYDRGGDRHYDTISAFIKSMRGSDPNASLYYLARMVLAGEDPVFIARRMVIFASEDISNASPNALGIATSCLTAVQNIGMPEAEIILAHCATFLACCPKSNASYLGLGRAKEAARTAAEIPLHIRNAPTGLMERMGYAKGYRYPHDFEGHFVDETYLPKQLEHRVFYKPTAMGSERAIQERLALLWPKKYS